MNELITQYSNNVWDALFVALNNEGIRYNQDYVDVNATNSVRLITYSLQMTNASKWDKFKALTDKLTQAAQLDNKGKVRLDYNGLDYRIEVPKPKQLHGKPDMRDLFRYSNGLNVSVGISAYDNKPSMVDFSGNDAGHMLVSGITRCGKTNILKLLLLLAMHKNSPDNVRVAVIDTKKAKGKYSAIENSTHLVTETLDSERKALKFLTWVKIMLDKLQGRKYDKKVIIVIDEVYFLMKNPQIKELLTYIASIGAESGFHIIAATQYTKVDDLGGKQFKGNLMTRIAGKTDDHYASANATGRDGVGAENLTKPGDFLLVNDDVIERIAVPEIFDNYYNNIERGMSPIVRLSDVPDVDGNDTVTVKAPSIAACFDKIDPKLLKLASSVNPKTGKPYGADVIRKASKVLASRGIGSPIGQGTANEYVKFGRKLRGSK